MQAEQVIQGLTGLGRGSGADMEQSPIIRHQIIPSGFGQPPGAQRRERHVEYLKSLRLGRPLIFTVFVLFVIYPLKSREQHQNIR